MRYVLIFILVATVVLGFVFVDQFPHLLAHYPRLQEANWKIRSWLGMECPPSSRVLRRELQETGQLLREESPGKKKITEQDLQEYQE